MEHIVDFEEALAIVAAHAAGLSQPSAERLETVPLLESSGRVLARPVCADRDQPPFHRSTRDGFAVQAAPLAAGPLPIAGEVRAGSVWPGPLAPGSALSIMTGAPVPEGADAVVMVEHVLRQGHTIALAPGRTLAPGENIVPRGAEATEGAVVVPAGTLAGAAEIALAANCGSAHLQVFPRPRVAIVATGDELVELSDPVELQQIRNSNSYAIATMVAATGGQPDRLPIARDLRDQVRNRVEQGRSASLLIFSGGVSMGDYDLVEEVLASFHAEFFFTGVRMQPGKPVVFGRLPALANSPACYFFGLPGNPISTQVTFHCFAEPFLRALSGNADHAPRWAQATLAEPIPARPNLTRLLPARLHGVHLRLVPWQGSGDLAANARANCYAELLPGTPYAAGDTVRVLLR